MSRIVRKAGDLPGRSLWQKIRDVALMDVAVLARGGVPGGSLERLERLAQTAFARSDEELLLRVKEAEEIRLRDARMPRNRVRRGAVEAGACELPDRCLEHVLAALFCGLPRCGCHGRVS